MISDDRKRGELLAQYISWLRTARIDPAWMLASEGHVLQRELAAGIRSISAQTKTPSPVANHWIGISPSFRAIDDPILDWMMLSAITEPSAAGYIEWYETLLRFCEIRRNDLFRRAEIKWGRRSRATNGLINLGAAFAGHFSALGDARYLNILLKIGDLKQIWSGLEMVPSSQVTFGEAKGALRAMCVLAAVDNGLLQLESGASADD